ncbi:LOW QUALITY PROTEIN: arf-GAP domain and FG repeat-containing protein 2-like [Corapipo altera]|uniref:LOW QUALITY PROTEIN: arf-GAP domain and FG repeat-containing protein 2-like n=1 Tax=Corapipo altera TaxID=415028 RepID=UPI000FD67C97|nr:LOW QUALITY PROTEIN: arf-GAP domain and FG repeat-containing protein 2-like [Corapipo altera]
MAAGGGGGPGPGAGPSGGPGGRRGSAGRDAEAEVWCRRVRELVSAAPANRLCFECGQRGVTYVDISVGSLVCTACSGALRGLNPPHRVKSISMTTFSEAEVLFLQERGNEVSRRVWLGTFDPRISELPDSRDPQKVKEFLQEKYEKKRWYVPPEQVKAPQSTTEPPQLLLGDTGTLPQPRPAAQRPPQPPRKSSTDLLADIGGDPFATPTLGPTFAAFPGPAQPHSAFPRFDAFGATLGAPTFGGAGPPFHTPPTATGIAAARGGATSAPPTGGGASSSLFGTLGPPPSSTLWGLHQPLRDPPALHQPLPEQRPRCRFHHPLGARGVPQPLPGRCVAFWWVQRCQSLHQPLRDGPDSPVGHQAPDHQPLPIAAAPGWGGLGPGRPQIVGGSPPRLRQDQVLFLF